MSRDRDRAKAVFAAVIGRWGTDEPLLRTMVYKAFYFAHLSLMHTHGAQLSDWPIVKMPKGPGPDKGSEVLAELVAEGAISEDEVPCGMHFGFAYKVKEVGAIRDRVAALAPEELAAIDRALASIRGKTGAELSRLTHQWSRSWNEAPSGAELPIYADLLEDDEETAKIRESLARAKGAVSDIF